MRSFFGFALSCAALCSVAALSACGKKPAEDTTNVIEMNPNDGSINDQSAIESTTIDQAGGDSAAGNEIAADNVSNGV